ncbi:HYC_CC_PP family protein [Hydrotalea sp.]|uniref:HYC_CC_PP family protein n=1 Tax=Hydrotalea sp. TaxID=2881279 RepID=UPI003D0F1A27
MKKAFTILLMLLYGLSVQGATFNVHYCMGKWAGIDLVKKSNNQHCSSCGMLLEKSRKNNCCSDVQQTIKVSTDQSASNFFNYAHSSCVEWVTILPTNFILTDYTFLKYSLAPAVHAPPLKQAIPLFVRNCIFRI